MLHERNVMMGGARSRCPDLHRAAVRARSWTGSAARESRAAPARRPRRRSDHRGGGGARPDGRHSLADPARAAAGGSSSRPARCGRWRPPGDLEAADPVEPETGRQRSPGRFPLGRRDDEAPVELRQEGGQNPLRVLAIDRPGQAELETAEDHGSARGSVASAPTDPESAVCSSGARSERRSRDAARDQHRRERVQEGPVARVRGRRRWSSPHAPWHGPSLRPARWPQPT
jgi:hypothetical protein